MREANRESGGPVGSWAVLFSVAFGVLTLDQLTKAIVVSQLETGESIPMIDGFLNLVHVRNPGAAFSLLAEAPDWFRGPFFIAITIVAVLALLYISARLGPQESLLRSAMGAVLGGAVGNLIDRLFYGEVVDFVDVHWRAYHWPAFNVADSCITLAVLAILLHSLLPRNEAAIVSPGPAVDRVSPREKPHGTAP